MPTEIAQNLIELSDFSEGFMPDAPEASLPPTGLPDVLNLLPDRITSAPVLRNGFERVEESLVLPADQEAHFIFYFEAIFSAARHKYLIVISTDNTDNMANNESFNVLDFDTGAWTRKAQFQAPHGGYEHWGAAIQNVWYGGTGGIPMYSWNPETNVFTADASALPGTVLGWVDDVNDAVSTVTEIARDHAFKLGERVTYLSKAYTAARSNRFADWVADDQYSRGDHVTHEVIWESTSFYPKSFECIKSHNDDEVDAEPGVGADWRLYWKRLRLKSIKNADGDTTDDWFFLPLAAQTIVGTFHGERLWLRRHDEDNWSRLQYSQPLKPEKNADIADLTFDPSGWDAADTLNGDGGGWLDFRSGDGDAIRALQSFGSYLIVFKRWGTWVIAGTNESTWNVRVLDPNIGTLQGRSVAVLGGLCYFLTPGGELCVTDGTAIEPAPGTEKVRTYIKQRVELMLSSDDDVNWLPTLTPFQDYLFISLCDPAGDDPITLVYHPPTQSFWPTDLPILDACVGRIEGSEKMWFVPAVLDGIVDPQVFEYKEDPDDGVYSDIDVSTDALTVIAIPWHMRSAWMNFGVGRTDRRIRRTWALVETAQDVTITGYRHYELGSSQYAVTRTPTGTTPHLEGKMMGDAKSVSIKLSGSDIDEPVAIYGIAADTQPRRVRYHTDP